MKTILKFCLIIFSVLLVSSGFAKHMGNQKISNACIKHTAIVDLPSQNLPQGGIVQIRHRSPEEVDHIMVPSPNEVVLYLTSRLEIAPDYISKWNTYFNFQIENLPDDQASPPPHSLRAPPFSC
jgi:hypothetical protein